MHPGALRNAEAALQLMPQHLDMLFVRANCLHSLSGEPAWLAGCVVDALVATRMVVLCCW
jgi:hypothetical protein